jgi:hypothetical protein
MMKIVEQTSTKMVVKADARTVLIVLGVIIVIGGILVGLMVRIEPLTYSEVDAPALIKASQDKNPSDSQLQTPSTGYAGLNLAHYVGQLLFNKQRPIVPLGFVAIAVGLFILIGPHYGQKITLDKTGQQVVLSRSKWFFRSQVESYPLQNISEVRAEPDREALGRSDRKYRAELVISHSEGLPLSRDYIYYRTVFPLTKAYHYDYAQAQEIVDEIRTFMRETEQTIR